MNFVAIGALRVKILVIRTGTYKMLVRITNREDLDQSDLGLHCLSKPFCQTTSV